MIKHCIKELSRLNELYRNQNYEINLKNVILVAAATRYKHIDSWIIYSKETIVDKFKNCLEYHKENGKEVCVRCKPQFSLMKEGDEVKCAYLPTLFDAHFREYYLDINKKNIYNIENVFANDYNSRQGQFMPCKEAVNIGTEENPSYSCSNLSLTSAGSIL